MLFFHVLVREHFCLPAELKEHKSFVGIDPKQHLNSAGSRKPFSNVIWS